MKWPKIILFILALLLSFNFYAQDEDFDDVRLYYRTDMSGGLLLHSNGWGMFLRKSKRKTGFKKRIFSGEIVNMKHPKEYKSFTQYLDDTKGYYFGKLNSLTIIRPSIGKQKTIYSKETKRGVEISYLLLAGPSIGVVKPVYLEIASPSVAAPNSIKSIEKYDPDIHTLNNIYGRASATKGIEESKLYPGIHGKFGLNFEYAALDDLIRAIETGVSIDLFHKEVPIMAPFPPEDIPENRQFYFTFYVHIQFGKKYF